MCIAWDYKLEPSNLCSSKLKYIHIFISMPMPLEIRHMFILKWDLFLYKHVFDDSVNMPFGCLPNGNPTGAYSQVSVHWVALLMCAPRAARSLLLHRGHGCSNCSLKIPKAPPPTFLQNQQGAWSWCFGGSNRQATCCLPVV